jgi:hypothetical protein
VKLKTLAECKWKRNATLLPVGSDNDITLNMINRNDKLHILLQKRETVWISFTLKCCVQMCVLHVAMYGLVLNRISVVTYIIKITNGR